MRRISFRTRAGKSTLVCLRSFALRFGGAPEIFVRAMSMPSAEVPDIRPRTRSGLCVVGKGERRFHHRGRGEHRGERGGWGEKVMCTWDSILFDGVGASACDGRCELISG